MDGIIGTGFRTLISFSALLLLTRLMGKKQLGQMNIFTFITGITVGGMTAEIILHKDLMTAESFFGLALWCMLAILVEYIALKSAKARIALDGEPSILIKKGQIDEEQLRKRRLNLDDLTMLLRTNSVFSITDVDYAILEPNGDLSVLKKPEKEFITQQDMDIPPKENLYIPSEIIADGKIVVKNLAELGKSEDWLSGELAKQGISSHTDVFFAELQSDGSLYIQRR